MDVTSMYYLKQYDTILAKFNIYFDSLGFRVENFEYDKKKNICSL